MNDTDLMTALAIHARANTRHAMSRRPTCYDPLHANRELWLAYLYGPQPQQKTKEPTMLKRLACFILGHTGDATADLFGASTSLITINANLDAPLATTITIHICTRCGAVYAERTTP